MASTPPPRPILPAVMDVKMTIFDIDPLEMARQITLIEFELFKVIHFLEFSLHN